MRRGEHYRVEKPSSRDPKGYRVFVNVSRGEFLETTYPSVICAPVYSKCNGLSSEVQVGVDEGLKHDSCIRRDELVSLQKSIVTYFLGTLSPAKIQELNMALNAALEIE